MARGLDEIDNSADIIDSRDVIERIEHLELELQDAHEGEGNDGKFDAWLKAMADNDAGTLQGAASELIALRELQEGSEGYSDDWQHGAQLIRDSYFETYAQALADDIGAIDANANWPCDCIDWEKAANELRQDYTAVEFGDVTYWVR